MRSVRNCFELIVILIVLGAALYSQRVAISDWLRERTKPELPIAVEYEEAVKEDEEGQEGQDSQEVQEGQEDEAASAEIASYPEEPAPRNDEEIIEPESYNLAVPFTSQAPNGNWSVPFKEACEEASLYMVHAYYQGVKETAIDPETATTQLQKIVAFEKELFGYYEDTTTEQTGTLAELMYGYATVEIIDNPTVDQIKAHIAAGRPVIVPMAGRLLGNPFYTAPGPLYHMLVIRGYTKEEKFITNDPGTKHGEAYLYDFDTLMSAMHDWNGGGEITEGKKVILVVYP